MNISLTVPISFSRSTLVLIQLRCTLHSLVATQFRIILCTLTGQPIFSIDIHPDGSRFATGGQGDGGSSGKVVIWNMTPVCSAEDEKNGKIPKVLCVMENHLGMKTFKGLM